MLCAQAACTPSSKKQTFTRSAAAAQRAQPENTSLKAVCQVNQTGDLTVIDDLPAKQRAELQQLCSLRCSVT
jgi:hypothetical protein